MPKADLAHCCCHGSDLSQGWGLLRHKEQCASGIVYSDTEIGRMIGPPNRWCAARLLPLQSKDAVVKVM